MPGTGCGGRACRLAIRSVSETESRCTLRCSRSLPARQVHIASTMAPAAARGTQPPSAIFSAFEPRNTRSSARNGASSATHAHSGHFQWRRATTNSRATVTTMVVVTATP